MRLQNQIPESFRTRFEESRQDTDQLSPNWWLSVIIDILRVGKMLVGQWNFYDITKHQTLVVPLSLFHVKAPISQSFLPPISVLLHSFLTSAYRCRH